MYIYIPYLFSIFPKHSSLYKLNLSPSLPWMPFSCLKSFYSSTNTQFICHCYIETFPNYPRKRFCTPTALYYQLAHLSSQTIILTYYLFNFSTWNDVRPTVSKVLKKNLLKEYMNELMIFLQCMSLWNM